MNYVRSNSLKYQGFPPSDCQDIGIRKLEFVAKTQFLFKNYLEEKRVCVISSDFPLIELHNRFSTVSFTVLSDQVRIRYPGLF